MTGTRVPQETATTVVELPRIDRINTQTMRATAGSDHPFASCQVMRSHYGPLGRTRGANPPDLSSIPGPCTSLHFFLSFFRCSSTGRQFESTELSGWGPKLVLIHQVPRSNPELPNFLSFSLSSRIVPPFRTNLLQDKRFRGGDRVQIHNHESHSWFGPPFASCDRTLCGARRDPPPRLPRSAPAPLIQCRRTSTPMAGPVLVLKVHLFDLLLVSPLVSQPFPHDSILPADEPAVTGQQ